MSSGVKDEKPLALRVWSLNGGVIRIQLTRLADFADGDAIHGAIHAFTKALAGSRAPSDAALVEALEAISKGDWLGVQRFAEDSDGDFLLRVIAKMRAVSRVALAAAKGQP